MPIFSLQTGVVGLLLVFCSAAAACGAPNDWAEGSADRADGATRDFYNRGAQLRWKNYLGDWRDAADVEQGNKPFGSAQVSRGDAGNFVEFDVAPLVRLWVSGKLQNQGFLLRAVDGSGTLAFHSREAEDAAVRPQLVIAAEGGERTLSPVADTFLEPSTYRDTGGKSDRLKVGGNVPALLRFDLSDFKPGDKVASAKLRLALSAAYGNSVTVGVFRCAQGDDEPPTDPIPGLAAKYRGDKGVADDSDVLLFANFEADDWGNDWTAVGNREVIDTVDADPKRKFQPLDGKALRVRIGEGNLGALNTLFKFARESGGEPDEIYFRYYLRLGDDWNQTVQGGKMPGLSGTYGVAGWGGRKSNGHNGWSARGSFGLTIPQGNPLAGLHPIGTYCYHADMEGYYGDGWYWSKGYRGFLENNRWYSVEQYLKLNTPGEKDGVLRAWIDGRPAFEKTDIRFRLTDKLKIEQVWMNVYHGGTTPSPYDQHLFIDNVVIARKYIGPMQAN